ncbi:hypothetical protein ND2E_2164 [Colwellia psychrerythraea]|uniref:SnoaL-like domain-containing protein n=2 Tax=Colwellia psychrerythraea TaxID=28229 RepID=A0A099KT36_COLPS|nr:hypothetical protein ND2E_2164 [Colwellia psychrerythraea]
MRIILSLFIIFILNACASTHENNQLPQVVKEYFDTYSQRDNFKKFMSYYADNAQFKDIIYGNSLQGKDEIKEFLNWDKGEFETLMGTKALTVTKHTYGKNTVITEGYFHTFSYYGQKLGPWLFVITLEFDSENKIIKQTDWINYTPRANFLGGKNMNEVLERKEL